MAGNGSPFRTMATAFCNCSESIASINSTGRLSSKHIGQVYRTQDFRIRFSPVACRYPAIGRIHSTVHRFPTELQERQTESRELNQFPWQRLGLHCLVGERSSYVERFVLQIFGRW
jgi:hypothetical protein